MKFPHDLFRSKVNFRIHSNHLETTDVCFVLLGVFMEILKEGLDNPSQMLVDSGYDLNEQSF